MAPKASTAENDSTGGGWRRRSQHQGVDRGRHVRAIDSHGPRRTARAEPAVTSLSVSPHTADACVTVTSPSIAPAICSMPGFRCPPLPSSRTAARLHKDAGRAWPDLRDEVLATLAASPRDAVLCALLPPGPPTRLEPGPLAASGPQRPVGSCHRGRCTATTGTAARRLKKMRKLAGNSDKAAEVDHLIAEPRETRRRRPRLQQEFDRAGLP